MTLCLCGEPTNGNSKRCKACQQTMMLAKRGLRHLKPFNEGADAQLEHLISDKIYKIFGGDE